MQKKSLYHLALAHAPALGPQQFLTICDQINDLKSWIAHKDFKQPSLYLAPQTCSYLENIPWGLFKSVETWQTDRTHSLLYIDDPNYPALLKNIADPPLVLYIDGNKNNLTNWQLAMVGSRHPTPLGLKTAHDWAAVFARQQMTINSGLAAGIDGASHRGTLSVDGITIAVLGSGLHHLYPKRHKQLAQSIVEKNGTLVSEFPLPTPPLPFNFPRRNRIISGLSRGILIIEAALKSGSLITAYLGLEQGKEIIAIPGAIDNPQSAGCHALIREGAALATSPEEVLALWPDQFNLSNLAIAKAIPLQHKAKAMVHLPSDPNAHLLWETVSSLTNPWSIDTLALATRLTTSDICSILCTFEINGLIESVPGGYRSC